MLTSVHPVVLAAAIGAVVALVALIVAWAVRSKAIKATMFVLAIVCLLPGAYMLIAMNPWLVDSRFRTYRAFYRDIRQGMTRDEVMVLIERHYPKTGARQRPKIMSDDSTSLGFFMNPETSREPNCEGIFLSIENGRVRTKTYSPD
jgi:hypothetical protein